MKRFLMVLSLLTYFTATCCPAAQSKFKEWYYNATDSYWEAFTTNASGSSLGIICFGAGNCLAYYRDQTSCEDGNSYSVLLNSDSGAQSLVVSCKKITNASETMYLYVLGDFITIRDLMLKDHSLGLAIPLASGQFKVLRFSLEGTNESFAAVVNGMKEGNVSNTSANGKNQVL